MGAWSRVFMFLLAIVGTSAVFAGPRETSVWIEVTREHPVDFNGYKLFRSAEGMGVALPGREVVTAAHVVWWAKTVDVIDIHGARMRGTIIGIDQDLDLAILRVDRELPHVASLRELPGATGLPVSAIGLREEGQAPEVLGSITVAKWPVYAITVPVFFSSVKGERGMSGGGFFDEQGAVAAIIVRVHDLGYLSAVPIHEVCKRFSRCPGVHKKE